MENDNEGPGRVVTDEGNEEELSERHFGLDMIGQFDEQMPEGVVLREILKFSGILRLEKGASKSS